MALALTVKSGLFAGQALAAETDKAQRIVRNGEQASIKGPSSFSPAMCVLTLCIPPIMICVPAAAA